MELCFSCITVLSPVRDFIANWELNAKRWRKYLRQGKQHGATITRILPIGIWVATNPMQVVSPFVLRSDGLFDLSRFDPRYFRLVAEIISIANDLGYVVWFDLFDACQDKYAFQGVRLSPYWRNVQGISGWADSKAYPYNVDWVREATKRFGVTVRFTQGNELEQAGPNGVLMWTKLGPELVGSIPATFGPTLFAPNHPFVRDSIKAAETTFGGQSGAIAVPVHGLLHPRAPELVYALKTWGKSPKRGGRPLFLSCDGTTLGASMCDTKIAKETGLEYRRPSTNEWAVIIQALKKKKRAQITVEYLPSTSDATCILTHLQAIREAIDA